MADEYGGWDWEGGGESPPPTDWDTSWFDNTDWGTYEAPSTPSWQQQYEAPQTPSWQQNYSWAPTPDIQDYWGPSSEVSPQDIQQWNQWQIPSAPLPGLGGQGHWDLSGVDSVPGWRQPQTWDYSYGETGPDPMAVPGPMRPWGLDSLPSQQDPREFYIAPIDPTPPDLTDPATRFEAGLSDTESRQQAQNMVAGGTVLPIHKTMQSGPEWLNPLANPQPGSELPWPIDASGIATVVPKGAFASSVWDVVRRVPGLAPFLESLHRNPTPIHLVDEALPGLFGQASARVGGQEAVSPGLLGLIRASQAPEVASQWRTQFPLFQPGQAGHEISVALDPMTLMDPAWNAVMPNAVQLPENTLIHELRHASGNLLPESDMYGVGRRNFSTFSQIPREMFSKSELDTILGQYHPSAWPSEIDARLFANQYFNPYLRR